MLTSARLVDRSVQLPHFHVLYGEEELTDAHVSTVAVSYRGSGDIRGEWFEEGQPFGIDVGVRIIDLLGRSFEPDQEPVPKVKAVGTALKVGPSVLRNGQEMKFVVLTDGPCELKTENPLAEVRVQRGAAYQSREDVREARRRVRRFVLVRICFWAVVIFVAFYLLTQPTGAADLFNRLGNALANWVNSL